MNMNEIPSDSTEGKEESNESEVDGCHSFSPTGPLSIVDDMRSECETWHQFPSERKANKQTNKHKGIIRRYVVVVLPLMVKERISMPIRPTSGAATSRTSEANWSRSRYTCATDKQTEKKKKNRNKWKCKSLSNSAGKIKSRLSEHHRFVSSRVHDNSGQFFNWFSYCDRVAPFIAAVRLSLF